MTHDQLVLLEDKALAWRREATQGNMDLRDYNRRCAIALEALLDFYAEHKPEQSA